MFASQLGVSSIQMNTPIIPGTKRWEYQDLRSLVETCEEFGLRLEAIENVPRGFYDKVMFGLPGRDEQLDNYCQTIRNVGRAGVGFSAIISRQTTCGEHPSPRLAAAAPKSPRSTLRWSRRRTT